MRSRCIGSSRRSVTPKTPGVRSGSERLDGRWRSTPAIAICEDLAMRQPRSGRQYTLGRGDVEAEVASIGASLRSLKVGDRDLVLPFDADEIRPVFRGCVLAPWPNRIAGGRWTYGGQ